MAKSFSFSIPGVTAGVAFDFTVCARDVFNNTASSYTGPVHFTSSDGVAELPTNATLISGIGTFSATMKTSGNQTLTATDTLTSSTAGTSGAVAVQAATATHFSVSAISIASVGSLFSLSVAALDQFSNVAAGYGGTVHFTSSDSSAVLPANTTLVGGSATFSAALKSAGNQIVTATDSVTNTIIGSTGSINVVIPNLAPSVILPTASLVTNEDTDLTISDLSVTDTDAASADIAVLLTIEIGALTLSTSVSGGVTEMQVIGNGTGSVVITAPLAAINATLAAAGGLTFRGTRDRYGTDTLTVTVDDLGNSGVGGAKHDSKTKPITVTAVNDVPVVTVPAAQTIAQGSDLAISGLNVRDVDAGSANMVATLSVSHGKLTVDTAVPGGVETTQVSGNGTGNVTLTGSVSAMATTLASATGVSYRSLLDYSGNDTFIVTAHDQGNYGSGGNQKRQRDSSHYCQRYWRQSVFPFCQHRTQRQRRCHKRHDHGGAGWLLNRHTGLPHDNEQYHGRGHGGH